MISYVRDFNLLKGLRFGQLAQDRQAHAGAVDFGTPQVAYEHAPGTHGNTARLTAIVYPSGFRQELEYDHSGSISSRLSRVMGLREGGQSDYRVLYLYAGAGRLVQMHYPQVPGLRLTWQRVDPETEPPGDGGDPYAGYDRFGRTEDLRWMKGTASPVRLFYGYDRASRRAWRQDGSSGAAPGLRREDLAWQYDGLGQVLGAQRGALNTNRTAIGGIPEQAEAFGYDETGNWLGYREERQGVTQFEQTRGSDRDNRLVKLDGSSAGIGYDQAGNLTEGPLNEGGPGSRFKWDAWNRLVEVRDAEDEVVMGCGYDALHRRITKSVAVTGQEWHSYYSERWKPLEECSATGGGAQTLRRRYFWGTRPGHRDELASGGAATGTGVASAGAQGFAGISGPFGHLQESSRARIGDQYVCPEGAPL